MYWLPVPNVNWAWTRSCRYLKVHLGNLQNTCAPSVLLDKQCFAVLLCLPFILYRGPVCHSQACFYYCHIFLSTLLRTRRFLNLCVNGHASLQRGLLAPQRNWQIVSHLNDINSSGQCNSICSAQHFDTMLLDGILRHIFCRSWWTPHHHVIGHLKRLARAWPDHVI